MPSKKKKQLSPVRLTQDQIDQIPTKDYLKSFYIKRDDNGQPLRDVNGHIILFPHFSKDTETMSDDENINERSLQESHVGKKEIFDANRKGQYHLEEEELGAQPGFSVGGFSPDDQEELWYYIVHDTSSLDPRNLRNNIIHKVKGKEHPTPGVEGPWHKYLVEMEPQEDSFNFMDIDDRLNKMKKWVAKARSRNKISGKILKYIAAYNKFFNEPYDQDDRESLSNHYKAGDHYQQVARTLSSDEIRHAESLMNDSVEDRVLDWYKDDFMRNADKNKVSDDYLKNLVPRRAF